MESRIKYINNMTGHVWFVDALINGAWVNISSHKTRQEATYAAAKLAGPPVFVR